MLSMVDTLAPATLPASPRLALEVFRLSLVSKRRPDRPFLGEGLNPASSSLELDNRFPDLLLDRPDTSLELDIRLPGVLFFEVEGGSSPG